MVEQVARHQNGTPSRGARRGDILDRHPARSLGFVLQQANQCIQVGSQLIFASEMGDHALLDFLALAHRLDQTQVLMTTIGSLDRAKEHTASCGTTYTAVLSAYSIGMLAHSNDCLSLHFFAAERSGVENTKLSDYGPPKSVEHALAPLHPRSSSWGLWKRFPCSCRKAPHIHIPTCTGSRTCGRSSGSARECARTPPGGSMRHRTVYQLRQMPHLQSGTNELLRTAAAARCTCRWRHAGIFG